MSLNNVKQIIDQALANPELLELLFHDPAAVLKGYQLTEAEETMFKNLSTGPYAHAKRGLLEIKKLAQAAEDYSTSSEDE